MSGPAAGNGGDPHGAPTAQVDAVARALRDAGHEVVLAAPGVSADALAAAAVQEDVVAIALVSAATEGSAGELPDALAAYGGGDIVVFALDHAVA